MVETRSAAESIQTLSEKASSGRRRCGGAFATAAGPARSPTAPRCSVYGPLRSIQVGACVKRREKTDRQKNRVSLPSPSLVLKSGEMKDSGNNHRSTAADNFIGFPTKTKAKGKTDFDLSFVARTDPSQPPLPSIISYRALAHSLTRSGCPGQTSRRMWCTALFSCRERQRLATCLANQ